MYWGMFLTPFLRFVDGLTYGETLANAKVIYFVEKAVYFGRKGDVERAIRYLDRAVNLNADSFYANSAFAIAYCQKKEFDRALGYANKAALSHTEGVSRSFREMLDVVSLVIFEMVGDNKSSQTFVERVAGQHDGDLGYVYTQVGLFFASLGIYEKAEPWYEKAITFDPKQCAFYYYLARAYAGERKFELAKKKLTLSLELAESKKWKRAVLRELGRIKAGENSGNPLGCACS